MEKILKYNEIKDRVLYSEEYEVNYWTQKFDGHWIQKSEMYYGIRKGENFRVQKRWEKEHKNDRLINVIYQ